MDARLELDAANRADELEDAAIGNARRYVRGILQSLKAAGEADDEHDAHLSRATQRLTVALGILEGIEQLELPIAEPARMERAS